MKRYTRDHGPQPGKAISDKVIVIVSGWNEKGTFL